MNSVNVFASQISLTCYFYLSFTKKKKKKFSAFIIKTKKKKTVDQEWLFKMLIV